MIPGMLAISTYFGLPKPKANRLAAQGLLPGVFKLGREYFLDPVAAEAVIAEKARHMARR